MSVSDKLSKRSSDRKKKSIPDDMATDSRMLQYELSMLVNIQQQCQELKAKQDTIILNALIESYAIHCRALIACLFGHCDKINSRFSDVIAYDLNSQWVDFCPVLTPDMERAKEQADKQVARMTTTRREFHRIDRRTKPEWNLTETTLMICRVAKQFFDTTPKGEWDISATNDIDHLLTAILRTINNGDSTVSPGIIGCTSPPVPPLDTDIRW